MLASKISRFETKLLNGFLPVYKPAGICANKLQHLIKWDIYFVLNMLNIKHGTVACNYLRYLEPFAEGLLTFELGSDKEFRKKFMFADYSYKATFELGVAREFICSDGKITGTASIEHVTEDAIQETLATFVGINDQYRSRAYPGVEISRDKQTVQGSRGAHITEYYDQIRLPPKEPKHKITQKYPLCLSQRTNTTKNITMIAYRPPHLELEIDTQGSFSVRTFCKDLASKLGTEANVATLARTKEGPMTFDDSRVLQLHFLNVEHYVERLQAWKPLYRCFENQFDAKRPDELTVETSSC